MRRLLLLCVLVATSAACAIAPKPVVAPLTVAITVTDGVTPLLGALVVIDASDPLGTHTAASDASGTATLPLVPAYWKNAQLTVTAAGCQQHGESIDLSVSLVYRVALTCRMYPAETGLLHVVGTHFFTTAEQPWQGRSASQFLLCARLWAGQSIAPQLSWLAQHGKDAVRVFGPVNWPDAFAQGLEMTPTADQLDACFSAIESAGLRVEYTALTYAFALDQQRAFVQTVFDVAAKHWGVFVEVSNEPEVNGIDPVTVMRGLDRHRVLAAYGLDPERKDCATAGGCFSVPVLDYATSHDLARDEAHSPRNSKDTRDAEDVLHVPVWDDEPIGVIDPARYNFHQTSGSLWERPGGGSVRTTNCDITTAHAAIALMLTGLTTYHSQAGLEGRVPAADEPIQAQCASQIGALGSIIGVDAQLGAYSRPGINWPITWTAGDTDSLVQHAYASISTTTAYVVVPMPSVGWTLQPIDPWHVAQVSTQPWIARLTR